ncbi:MAG: GNAT family N-acetyltransferase [Caldilineae bacterium]|nr:MAG: GNAT family N-acetyltransferase [Caldilineae bacterium]
MLNTENVQNLSQIRIRKPSAEVELVPADRFTLPQLTDIYNQTRVDYLVPMPMNERKMREYIHNYDVDLAQSVVAVSDGQPLGLAMLGVRGDVTWVTRMGIIPNGRQKGIGRKMLHRLLENSRRLQAKVITLDVIKNNTPAETLFRKTGFRQTRELLVVRRPPKPVNVVTAGAHVESLGYREAVELLKRRDDPYSWLTATESMLNAGNLSALYTDLPDGSRGWLVYQNTVFQLGRLVFKAERGDPTRVAIALLENLHWRHPVQDSVVENLPLDYPYWPAMQQMGYIVSFRRIEMVMPLTE